MRLCFVDDNPDVADALAKAFRAHPEVEVIGGDILHHARNCLVSPANAQGFMDGGIDRAFVTFFGSQIETKVRTIIGELPNGSLAIGSGIVVQTGHAQVPYLIVVPTMESPEAVSAMNAYRAMRAMLRIAKAHEEIGRSVYCPGLCTGVGAVSPEEAAGQMLRAYEDSFIPPRI